MASLTNDPNPPHIIYMNHVRENTAQYRSLSPNSTSPSASKLKRATASTHAALTYLHGDDAQSCCTPCTALGLHPTKCSPCADRSKASKFCPRSLVLERVDSFDVLVSDSGASMGMTADRRVVRTYSVERYRKFYVVFHRNHGVPVTLTDVAFVPGLGFNMSSLHSVQDQITGGGGHEDDVPRPVRRARDTARVYDAAHTKAERRWRNGDWELCEIPRPPLFLKPRGSSPRPNF